MTCIAIMGNSANHTLNYAGSTIISLRYADQQLTNIAYSVNVSNISTTTGVGVQIQWFDWTGTHIGAGPLLAFTHPGGLLTGNWTPPAGATGYEVAANVASGHDGTTVDIDMLLTPTCGSSLGSYCAYGTKPTGITKGLYYLTPGLIDLALIALELPFLAPFFTAYWFSKYDVDDLCSGAPPTMPELSAEDLLEVHPVAPYVTAGPKISQALAAVLWPYFCSCKPATGGGAAPVAYPNPVALPDPRVPSLPSIDCDTTSLCTALAQLMLTVATQTETLRETKELVTLVQRQAVPFAYLPGQLHSAQVGAGTFDVHAILGLSITATTIPDYLTASMAPVNSYYRLGEVSFGTVDGFSRREVITHSPHLFLGIDPSVTLVAFRFEPGVVGDLLELVREP